MAHLEVVKGGDYLQVWRVAVCVYVCVCVYIYIISHGLLTHCGSAAFGFAEGLAISLPKNLAEIVEQCL
jgi:hypothetical protein